MSPQTAQILLIVLGVLQYVSGATAQLDLLVGITTEKIVVAILTLVTGSLSIVVGILIGPSRSAANLTAMAGVTRVVVNDQAGQSLAKLAVDPTTNVVAAPGQEAAISKIARGE